MSDNTITLRDHSQPCEHNWKLMTDGQYQCTEVLCPGGREIKVDEEMIERAALALRTLIPPVPYRRVEVPDRTAYMGMAERVLRAALEVTDE